MDWTGFLDPDETGDYVLGVKADGLAHVLVDDKRLAQKFGEASNMGPVHFEKGHPRNWKFPIAAWGTAPPSAARLGSGERA